MDDGGQEFEGVHHEGRELEEADELLSLDSCWFQVLDFEG